MCQSGTGTAPGSCSARDGLPLPQGSVRNAAAQHPFDEDAARILCEGHAARRNRIQNARETGRADCRKDLVRVTAGHKNWLPPSVPVFPPEQIKDRMFDPDAGRMRPERQLQALPAPDLIRIRPGRAKSCRSRRSRLIAGLTEPEQLGDAKETMRARIEGLTLMPVPPPMRTRTGFRSTLTGLLPKLLLLASGLPVRGGIHLGPEGLNG